MITLVEDASKFYREVVAPTEFISSPQGTFTTKISPITRMDFLSGSGLAILFLIQKVVMSTFFLFASISTLFQHKNFKASFRQNAQEMPKYLGAILLGYAGAFIPHTINKKILHLPQVSQKNLLSSSLSLLPRGTAPVNACKY